MNCTVAPEDQLLVSHLEAPLEGLERLDLLAEHSTSPGVQLRLEDVPFDPESGEVLMLSKLAEVQQLPAHTLLVTLLAVAPSGTREIGRYAFRHRPWPGSQQSPASAVFAVGTARSAIECDNILLDRNAAHLMSRRLRKKLLWSLGVALGLVVLVSATLMVAVQLIDTPKVRARLTEVLSTLLNGQVDWQQLEVRLLPLPHAVVRGLHVAIPDVFTVEVATADVKIRLLPLLRGNVELQAIILAQPSVEVWIARSTAGTTTEAEATTGTNPLELYRKAMRPVLDVVARFAPDTTVAVEAGRLVLNFVAAVRNEPA